MQRQRGDMLDVITISDPQGIDNIEKALAALLDIEIPQQTATPSPANIPAPVEAKNQNPNPMITEESRIWELKNQAYLEHSQVSILNNHGIDTIAQFLALSEEDFENIKNAKGFSFKAKYMEVQRKLKNKMGLN